MSSTIDIPSLHKRGRTHWHFDLPASPLSDWVEILRAAAHWDQESLYLAIGCQLENPAALRVFERELVSTVRPLLRRYRFPPDIIDDTCQDVLQAMLCNPPGSSQLRLLTYVERGQITAVLRVSALRRARYLATSRRNQDAKHRGMQQTLLPQRDNQDATLWSVQHNRLFKQSFQAALETLAPEKRALLKMRYLENLRFRELAQLTGTSTSSVGRRLTAIHDELLRNLREQWRQQTGASELDVEVAEAQLDLSLSRLLRRQS